MGKTEKLEVNLLDAWFVETKLKPPRSGFKLIDRPLLLSVFSSLIDKGSVCVTAPAGFGKSSLLSQWLLGQQKEEAKIAWVSLDEDDGELRQFVSYIVFALNRSGVDMGRLQIAAEHMLADIPAKSILPGLINILSRCSSNIVLILDDFHRFQSRVVSQFVEDLVVLAPESFKLIVCSRVLPNINTASLIAQGRLRELGPDSLRFTVEDTKAIFEGLLPIQEVATLHERTEGWPVALQFARLAMRKKGMLSATKTDGNEIEKFQISVHSTHIADYFAQQVFEQLPCNLQNLLLKTSIVERFDASLADAICESSISHSLINDSMALRPLLIPLDDSERWFRYHHLFAEFLLHRLSQQHDIDVKVLHIRASKWFEQEGQIAETVRHARLAKDFDRCARLIQEAGGWELILYGGIGYIRTLLRHVSEDDLNKFPRLRVAKAYLCIKDGAISEATIHLEKVERSSIDIQDDIFDRDKTMIITLLDVYNGEANKEAVNKRIKQDLEAWSKQDHLGCGVLLCAFAISEMGQGRFETARDAVVDAVKSMRSANSILGINYCYVHLGHIAFLKGEMHMAKAHYAEALSMAEDNFGTDSGLKSVCDVGSTILKIWQDETRKEALGFGEMLNLVCEGDGWFEIFSASFFARIVQAYIKNDGDVAIAISRQSSLVGEERGIQSLDYLSDVYALHAAMISKDKLECIRLSGVLQDSLKTYNQLEGIHWQFEMEAILALGLSSLSDGSTHFDVGALDSLVIRLDTMKAGLGWIRCVMLKAVFLHKSGDTDSAQDLVFSAAKIAVRENLFAPFLLHSHIRNLVHSSAKAGRERPGQQMETAFLNACVSRFPKPEKNQGNIALSVRESEVLFELSIGKTNKEIARALDMTHHTVKFHLKNVFVKLGAENRIHAINEARKIHLIS
ncbi:MAG: LuxR C-terminal-related transcriptional regulator [Cocleimonas sp.]